MAARYAPATFIRSRSMLPPRFIIAASSLTLGIALGVQPLSISLATFDVGSSIAFAKGSEGNGGGGNGGGNGGGGDHGGNGGGDQGGGHGGNGGGGQGGNGGGSQGGNGGRGGEGRGGGRE